MMKTIKKETLTSRQRVNMALNFQEPDRVPIDLGGFHTGIHKNAYADLINYLGINDDVSILCPIQQIVKPCEELLEKFHVDTRYITSKPPESFQGGIVQNVRNGKLWHDLKDEFGVVWSMPNDQQLYMDITHHPLKDATIKDLKDYPFPKGDDPSRFYGLREQALELRNETPYAISTGVYGVVYEVCWYMRGLERWFMDTIENQEFCAALMDQTLKYWKDYFSLFMKEVGDVIDIVVIGDDIAGQSGPLMKPDFYKNLVKPRQKELVQYIKSMTQAKIWYHTCGNCRVFIPELIDNGVDVLNPVQISARDMEPTALKTDFGKDIVFWGGGIDSQHILPYATPNVIKEEVRKNMQIFMPNGGYVFNNVHNIQAGVPAENIVAMYEAAREYGFYN